MNADEIVQIHDRLQNREHDHEHEPAHKEQHRWLDERDERRYPGIEVPLLIRRRPRQGRAKIAAGFEPNIMPNFKGQVSEQNVIQLIAYIKSLSPNAPASQQGVQQRPVVMAPRAKSAGNAQ